MALQASTRRKVNEWVLWFNYHSDKVAMYPPQKQMEWMLKAINGAYEVMSLLANEANNGFRSTGVSRTENGLLIPTSWKWDASRR